MHCASRDLAPKDFQTASTPGKSDHIPTLLAEMVEVEDEEVRDSAIDAPRVFQNLPNEQHVAALAGEEARIRLQAGGVRPPRRCPAGRATSMAVDAHDLTQRDLALEPSHGPSGAVSKLRSARFDST